MREWVRRQIDQLCNHLDDTLGTAALSDDIPEPLNYGQDAFEGVSTRASRSDHRHALSPAIYGAIPTIFFDLNTNSTSQNTNVKILNFVYGSNSGLLFDEPGAEGSFGMSGLLTGTASAHVAFSDSRAGSAAGDRSDRVHSTNRMTRFVMRCVSRRFPSASHIVAIGGYHETTGGVTPNITSMDDFLGFYIEVDGSGNGNFRAMAKSSTTGLTTDVDLGINWNDTGGGEYMNFAMAWDHDTDVIGFAIDDVLLTTITTENVPTEKLFGWGLFGQKTAAGTLEVWADDIIFLGRF